jgi:hypothetical protein
LLIVQLDTRRDLFNLSRTCRVLEDATMARLYQSVDLELPQSIAIKAILRPPVTESVRDLTMRHGRAHGRNSDYGRRRKSDADSVEVYVNEILNTVPMERLIRFGCVTIQFIPSGMTLTFVDCFIRLH